jgi:hypothetical protein
MQRTRRNSAAAALQDEPSGTGVLMGRSHAALVGMVLLSGCAIAHDIGGSSAALLAPIELSQACLDEIADAIDQVPKRLECTGLYKNLPEHELASGVDKFEPTFPLWSDASVKTRWIYLPEGTSIDASKPDNWVFPVGTRLWKEFRNPTGTKRIETRLFVKSSDDDWAHSTFVWNDDETEAVQANEGKDMMVDGKEYHVPSHTQCNECHNGRRERVLGFDQVVLGIPNPTSEEHITLADLVKQKKLKNLDSDSMEYQVGPDPESADAQALGWMHNNCGVSCHNGNATSKAYSNGMRLLLHPSDLDGRSLKEIDSVTTTVDKEIFATRWKGARRVVPGNPEESQLYKLITQRGDPMQQMPPLGSNEVDTKYTDLVKAWIVNLGKE